MHPASPEYASSGRRVTPTDAVTLTCRTASRVRPTRTKHSTRPTLFCSMLKPVGDAAVSEQEETR